MTFARAGLFFAWGALSYGCACPEATVRLEGEDATLQVCAEVADSESERRQGLMGRAPLGPDEGLLFTWPVESELCFFNRGVDFPIDIVFADATGTVVAIEREVPAQDETLRCQVAQTVLEVAASRAAPFSAGDRLIAE